MKLVELLRDQELILQLSWGERKIEFFSYVIDHDDKAVYVTPYLHNGSELEINITQNNGVVCNIFTNNPIDKTRISWKNVELTTIVRNNKKVYCIKSRGFNNIAEVDDRRVNGRVIVDAEGQLFDNNPEEGINIKVHDISDVGISFYAPQSFTPKSKQLLVTFIDTVGEKEFEVKVECTVSRIVDKEDQVFIGCKITSDNRDYQVYRFMKKLIEKKR